MVEGQTVSLSEIGQNINDSQSTTPTGANLLATQAELIKSEPVLAAALEDIAADSEKLSGPRKGERLTVEELQENLTVSILPATNILELTFTHPDPANRRERPQ